MRSVTALPLAALTLGAVVLVGCATSVPHARTYDARMEALVGGPQHAAYLAFGAPARVTTDGADGRIHRWEWTRETVEPAHATVTQTVFADTSSGTTSATATTLVTPERRRTDVRFAEVFTRADGTVYTTRHNLRTRAEQAAARNRHRLHAVRVTGVATVATLGALALGPLVFGY